jgi:pimeloyl-ACP methyl ester carboxylesterase
VRSLAPLAREHTVYALDLPGFGASRMGGRYTFARAVQGIAGWMEAQRFAPAAILGHSMGGHLAVLLAARYPAYVRAMVVIAPSGLPLGRNLLAMAHAAFFSRARGDARFTPIAVEGALRAGPRSLWQAVRQIERVDVSAHLVGLAVPTLILWGDSDNLLPVTNATLLGAAIAGAEVRVVPGGTHNVFFDEAEVVNGAVLAFLRRHTLEPLSGGEIRDHSPG